MAKKEKEQKEQEEETGITPVSEAAEITQVGEKIEDVQEEGQEDAKPSQSFGQIVRRIVLAILRLIIIVAVIGGIGATIYYGVPYVYQGYIRPVEQNTSQLNDLEFRQSQSEIELAELQTRLATLEAGQTTNTESLTDINSRVVTLEGADIQRNESLVELTYQSELLRAMELLSRARLFLYQSNFGLARLDVQAARDILAEMQLTAPEGKQEDLSEALFRLDLVLKNLPSFPVAASDDLDIAWQVLLDGYPSPVTEAPTTSPTVTPEATSEAGTPTAEPAVTQTSTPVP
ncbi:MAG TPA: hypothetical protein DCX53_10990 [Anaerolineae bacterium]|nr:hypothetical protein [Anaerolineae bacterium]